MMGFGVRIDEVRTYEVTGTVFGFCDTVSRTLRIRVKKNPEVVLEDTVSCPAGFVLSGDTTFVLTSSL